MRLSWNEIRVRASEFSKEWSSAHYEKGQTQTFYDEFFNIFDVKRRSVARFEEAVTKLSGKRGFIDLFWTSKLIVEHKSAGRDLSKASDQAGEYFDGLLDHEKPRYQLVCDFQNFVLLDRDTRETASFTLAELPQNVEKFGFIMGVEKRHFKDQDPVNIAASELVGRLHDSLAVNNYTGHKLEVFLTRLIFCLFADDTGIFEPRDILLDFLEDRTKEDGSDTGALLSQLFQVLNTPVDQRVRNLDEDLAQFPYVNGALFEGTIPIPAFDTKMRGQLIEASQFNWSSISPAIFGSLFQSVMDPEERRKSGAHYTTEKNIMKVIQPLFLDDLRSKFKKIKARKTKRMDYLQAFHKKLGGLCFLDPACGCGNFLIITYRELRLLEIEVLREIHPTGQQVLDVSQLSKIDVDQFYGIEIDEFPVRIAETALWMMDHLMNNQLSQEFGQPFIRIPLEKSPHILHANALEVDWATHLAPGDCDFVVGNPPFVGAKFMNEAQKSERASAFPNSKKIGVLDYVACWYRHAADYLAVNPSAQAAFVSTNSIVQGEQVGILWPILKDHGVRINFAHRTFQWHSPTRGRAAVHCVIVGFGLCNSDTKWIFEYDDVLSEPQRAKATNINPYLVDGPNVMLQNRSRPICDVPRIGIGNKPIDGGNYLFTPEEKKEFLAIEPQATPLFRRWIGSREFINGIERWCLWVGECTPSALRKMPTVMQRIDAVRKLRARSKSAPTRKIAATPTRFHVENMPKSDYLVIPKVSSERRPYVPVGFVGSGTLASDLVFIVSDASLMHFGVLSSHLHMAWMRAVCGRLESRYRYSAGIVYNNFPWPKNPSDKHTKTVEEKAQRVLDARSEFPNSSLADLYDPTTMPPVLVKAHTALDRAVERCYRAKAFPDERSRVEYLMGLYQEYTSI